MLYDEDGFVKNLADKDKCTKCNLCEMVCPVLNAEKLKHNDHQEPYAAVNKNSNVLMNSSSGGVFSVIAQYVLSKGGLVCGASFNDDFSVSHRLIDNVDDLKYLRGSKYLFSDNANTYSVIKEELKKGRYVYFTGTGCQVAGLKAFLIKDYDNLITSDIICHGTPSPKMFKAFLDYFETKKNLKVVSYNFRDKKVSGWSCSSSCMAKSKVTGAVKYIPYHKILEGYFKAFISGSINRESCYSCRFTTEKRAGDITLADYWGIENYHPEIESLDGVSFILVNSEKGRTLLSNLKDSLSITPSNIEWAAVINTNLRERTKRPERRNFVYNQLRENANSLVESFIVKGLDVVGIKFRIKQLIRFNDGFYRKIYNLKRKVR